MSIPESELSYGSILTLTGENAEINGKLNNKPINFTHIAIGDANDVYVQPSRTQTTLVNEITRIPVTGMEKITPSEPDGVPQLKVWAKIPDDIVDIAVREFAAVATFDGNSYLHAVGNSVRIPILSGSNNGGEVNDIFIEMTFAVTSLEPIVMIDPAIVTATRKFVEEEDAKHVAASDPHPQYTTVEELAVALKSLGDEQLKSMVGLIGEFHDSGVKQGWVDLKGGELSRTTDKLLWDYAVAAGMIVAQATKDADPMTHAMKFGDGDGATTFTLPNHHLGHFVRGTPSGVNHGDTQGDAIRNITGHVVNLLYQDVGGTASLNEQGAFTNPDVGGVVESTSSIKSLSGKDGVGFDASKVVPTADENRPYTANLSIKIHRGWM